jgi:hypothetical protein
LPRKPNAKVIRTMSTDTMPLLPSPGPTGADKLFMVFLVLVLLAVAAIGRTMYKEGLKTEISKQNTADMVQWLRQAGSQRFNSDFEPAQCAGGDANAANTWADCLPRLLADGGPLAGLRNPFTQKTPVFVARCEPGRSALAGALAIEKLTPGQPGAAQAFYASPLSGDDPINKKMQLRLSTCDQGGYAGLSTEVSF